jgi:hypothetical protein
MLARSTDGGSTWTTIVAVEGDTDDNALPFGYPSIAIDRNGVLGLVWPTNHGNCFRFAVSTDQGRTFAKPLDVTDCDKNIRLRLEDYSDYLSAVPWVEPSLGGGVGAPGVSLRIDALSPPVRAGKVVLLVDETGFHPVWADPRQGTTQIWTRTISVGDGPKPALDLEGLEEISKPVTFRFSNNRFNAPSSIFYVDLALINSGPAPICGPLHLSGSGLRSDYGAVEIDNADNGIRGDGAIWDMTGALEGGVLRPWSTSMPRTLAFKIANVSEQHEGNPVSVGLKLFGKTGTACSSVQ